MKILGLWSIHTIVRRSTFKSCSPFFFLVLASLQSQEALKDMLQNLLEYLWRLLEDLKNKIESSSVDSCTVFRREPFQTLRPRENVESYSNLIRRTYFDIATFAAI